MILISHRGNLNGPFQDENNPTKIEDVILKGFDVEIDLRILNSEFYLGHDTEDFKVSESWILKFKNKLWIHCKTISTIEQIHNSKLLNDSNYFFHFNDNCTFTSKGFLWVFPGFQPIKNSIAVLPELHNDDISKSIGICSDFIKKYKK
jgi:hypothetical protein